MNAKEFDPRRMTDAELEALLREENDDELLLQAAEEYAGRLERQGVEIPAAEAAWAAFAAKYMPAIDAPKQARPRKRIWRKVTAVAAAVAIGAVLLTITTTAMGVPFWNFVTEGPGDRFIIQWDEPETQPDPKKVLKKYDITRTGTPNWVPEHYRLNWYIDEPVGGATAYYAGIAPGLKFSVIPYYKGMEAEHEARGKAEVYRASGITYYIFTGFKATEVVWMEDGCECTLFWGQSVSQTKKLLERLQSLS